MNCQLMINLCTEKVGEKEAERQEICDQKMTHTQAGETDHWSTHGSVSQPFLISGTIPWL